MSVLSQSILLQTNTATKDNLAELWDGVLANMAKSTITGFLKNKMLSGNIQAGVLHAKRFANAVGYTYGTARAARAGKGIEALDVPISIDAHDEFIEEVEELDIMTYGVDGIIPNRTANQKNGVERLYERRFLNKAVLAGTVHTFTANTIQTKMEELIQTLETVQNDFVDGVEREMMAIVLDTATYGEARTYIDTTQNAGLTISGAEFGKFHGVWVFSSVRLPATVNYAVMALGSVAQPMTAVPYPPKQVEFSKATAFGTFIDSSTTVVTADLIFIAGTLGAATATSGAAAGGETTKTVITVTSTKSDSANEFYYLSGASAVAAPTYGTAVGTTWTKLVLTDNAQKITTSTHTKIRIAEVDASGRIIKSTGEIAIVNGA